MRADTTVHSDRVRAALARFEGGFNCAQAVCSAFGPPLGLDERTALRAAQAFGGGIAQRGEICGALAGALIVLGLQYGKTEAADDQSRDRTYTKARELLDRFRARHGSCSCRALIGYDLSEPSQRQAARDAGIFTDRCPGFVRDASEILESLV